MIQIKTLDEQNQITKLNIEASTSNIDDYLSRHTWIDITTEYMSQDSVIHFRECNKFCVTVVLQENQDLPW